MLREVLRIPLAGRLMEVGRQISRFANLLSSKKVVDSLRLWEGAPAHPGGEQDRVPRFDNTLSSRRVETTEKKS